MWKRLLIIWVLCIPAIQLSAQETYELEALGPVVTLNIKPANVVPEITSFTLSDQTLQLGDRLIISWESKNQYKWRLNLLKDGVDLGVIKGVASGNERSYEWVVPYEFVNPANPDLRYLLSGGGYSIKLRITDGFNENTARLAEAVSDPITFVDRANGNKVYEGDLGFTNVSQFEDFAREGYVGITGSLTLFSSRTNEDLAGLESLTFIGGNLFINRTSKLVSLDGLKNLRQVGGSIIIEENSSLKSISAMSLETASFIRVEKNPVLEDISNWSSLKTLHSSFEIFLNPKLQSISGFDNLEEIGGYFRITNNELLKTIDDFNKLKSIGLDFNLTTNPPLEDLLAFSGLESVGSSLIVGNNGFLRSLAGLEKVCVSANQIGNVFITGNTNLSACCPVTNMLSSQAGFTVENNGPNCGSLEAIKTACGYVDGKATLSSETIHFPTTEVGKRSVQAFLLENTGTVPLEIKTVRIDESGTINQFAYEDFDRTIPVGESREIIVYFEPTGLGDESGFLQLIGNVEKNPVTVRLSGKGAATGSLVYDGNVVLDSQSDVVIFGLQGWTAVNGNFSVLNDNGSIVDLSPLARLETVSGILNLHKLEKDANLTGLENLKEVGSHMQFTNSTVADLSLVSGIASIGGSLYINFNKELKSLKGLNSLLTTVPGSLNLHGNELLENVDGLEAITNVGAELDIKNNPKLTSLEGLKNITEIGNHLFIRENPLLNECCLIQDWLPNVAGTVSIALNGSDCASLQAIETSCSPAIPLDVKLTYPTYHINPDEITLFKQGGTAHHYIELQNITEPAIKQGFFVRYEIRKNDQPVKDGVSRVSDEEGRLDLEIVEFREGAFEVGEYTVHLKGVSREGYQVSANADDYEPITIKIVDLAPESREGGFTLVASGGLEGCLACLGATVGSDQGIKAEAKAQLLSAGATTNLGIGISLIPQRATPGGPINGLGYTLSGDFGLEGSIKGFNLKAQLGAAGSGISNDFSLLRGSVEVNETNSVTFTDDSDFTALKILYLMLEQSLRNNNRKWLIEDPLSYSYNETKHLLFESLHDFLAKRDQLPEQSLADGTLELGAGFAGRIQAEIGPEYDFSLNIGGLKTMSFEDLTEISGILGFGYHTSKNSQGGQPVISRNFSTILDHKYEDSFSASGPDKNDLPFIGDGRLSLFSLNRNLVNNPNIYLRDNRVFEMSTTSDFEEEERLGSRLSYGATKRFQGSVSIDQQDLVELYFGKRTTGLLKNYADENSVAAFLSGEGSAFRYAFDGVSSQEHLLDISGYLADRFPKSWTGDYHARRLSNFAEVDKLEFSFTLAAAFGWGVEVNMGVDFMNYNKNSYVTGENVFDPETKQLLPISEHALDPEYIRADLEKQRNIELTYLRNRVEEDLGQFSDDLKNELNRLRKRLVGTFENLKQDFYTFLNFERFSNGSFVDNDINKNLRQVYGQALVAKSTVRSTVAESETQDDFSTFEIKVRGDQAVFEDGTQLNYDYFYPDGEVYGVVDDDNVFLAISDIVFFTAEDEQNEVVETTQTGTYQVKVKLGVKDKEYADLVVPNGNLALYFRPNESLPWTLLAPVNDFDEHTFELSQLGRFTLGASIEAVDSDENAPVIDINLPEEPENNDAEVTISWTDDRGINPNSVNVQLGEQNLTVVSGDSELKIKLGDLPENLSELLSISVSDHAGNQTSGKILAQQVNRYPEGISPSGESINENLEAGSFIAKLRTDDKDLGDQHFYTVSDTERFFIRNDSLFSNTAFNFEEASAHEVTITTTDQGGFAYSKIASINVLDLNEAPLGISIDQNELAENNEANAVVGQLSSIDPDLDDSWTFEIGSLGTDQFQVIGSQLIALNTLDFETENQFEVEVKVTDSGGLTFTEVITIQVQDANDPPVLKTSIANQVADEDAAFSYQVPGETFFDEDGEVLTIEITGLPDGLSQTTGTATISGTPTQQAVGTHTITVTAKDGEDETAVETFELTVSNVNDAPVVANALSDTSIDEDAPYTYEVPDDTFFDEDGEPLTIVITGLPDGLSQVAGTATFSGTPAQEVVGSHIITVTATDAANESAVETFELTVSNVNDAPVVANTITDRAIEEDAAYTYEVPDDTFFDEDGEPLTIEITGLPDGLSQVAGAATISGTPTQQAVGTHTITVTAKDGENESAIDTFELTVSNVNDAPVVANALSDTSIDEDAAYTYEVPDDTFFDEDGEALTIVITGLPDGLSQVAGTATFSGTPAQEVVGSHIITVTATDAANESVEDTFELTISNVNDAPVVANTITDRAIDEDAAYTYEVPDDTFFDEDGEVLTIEITGLPDGLSQTTGTAIISGTPTQQAVGTHTITVTAIDGENESAVETFELTVSNVNDAPVVTNALSNRSIDEDVAYTYEVPDDTFFDEDGEVLTIEITGLPDGLSQVAGTAILSGTPTQQAVGTHTITVTATDGDNESAVETFELTVNNVNDAPVVETQLPDVVVAVEEPYELVIDVENAFDEDGDDLTIGLSGLPAGLSFNDNRISGTPTADALGSYTIRVTYTDPSGESAVDEFEMQVEEVTSLEEEKQFGLISLRPNPFEHELTVTVEKGLYGSTKFQLLSIGALSEWTHRQTMVGETQITLSIDQPLAGGLYLLVIQPEGKTPIIRKVLKQ